MANPQIGPAKSLERLTLVLAGVLIFKVTIGIIGNYPSYFPPDFRVDFLRGRRSYFFGAYQWAFYAHLGSGPVAILLGLFLVNPSARRRFPASHRVLGRVQVLVVALLVAPSGLVMAFRPAAGPLAGIGLGLLAVLTASTALMGGRLAVLGRFADHRRWMYRCFLLLCSAVVLRLSVGLATVIGNPPTWVDPLATWLSWLVPLAAFEFRERGTRRPRRAKAQSDLPGR